MDYKDVYTTAFKDKNYSVESNNYHYQASIDYLKKNISSGSSVIDVGSGRGQFLSLAKEQLNCIITSYDLEKFHDIDVEFIQGDLSKEKDREVLQNKSYDCLVSLGVLEHLDEACIDNVINSLSMISNKAFITVANHSDILNGVELHTIQKDINWWNEKFSKYYNILETSTHYDERLFVYRLVRL